MLITAAEMSANNKQEEIIRQITLHPVDLMTWFRCNHDLIAELTAKIEMRSLN